MGHIQIKLGSLFLILGLMTSWAGAQENEGFWIKAGPTYRGGMKVKVSGSSYTQEQGVHAARASHGSSPATPKVNDSLRIGDRTFEDGYVKKDSATGIGDDLTWYWGYDNASQYNVINQTLSFHNTYERDGGTSTRTSVGTLRSGALNDDESVDGIGFDLAGGYVFPSENNVRFGLSMGFSGNWNSGAKLNGSTYSEQITTERFRLKDTVRETYVYNVAGVAMPAAGHQGTYDGPLGNPPVIPSPTIPTRPSSASAAIVESASGRRISSSSWTAANQVNMEVDSSMLGFWVGPQLVVQANEVLSLHVTPRISLNYVDVDVSRNEQFIATYANGTREVLQSWHDKKNDSDWLFGLGVTLGLDLDFGNGFFAGAWGGYEWMSDDVKVDVGPNTIKMEAGNYALGLVLGYRFGASAQADSNVGWDVAAMMMQVREDFLQAEQARLSGKQMYDRLHAWGAQQDSPEKVKQVLAVLKRDYPEQYQQLVAYVTERRTAQAAATNW